MPENTVPASPIPLTIIGGYLGAGKTTLLNHMLRNNQNRRIAVIVNDFGSINIDAQLIEQSDGETIQLANGCICCSLVNGFVLALLRLTEHSPLPEHIIIEASGVSDPGKIAQFGISNPWIQLDGIIVVADAEMVRVLAADNYIGDAVMQQLRSADVIVLNKVDLISEQNRIELNAWMLSNMQNVHIVEAVQSNVPIELLIGEDMQHTALSLQAEHMPVHDHTGEYTSWSYASHRPFQTEAFRAVANTLPAAIIRAKGILWLANDPGRKAIFQLVGKRWIVEMGGEWGSEQPRNQLVLIGTADGIDAEQLTQQFNGALAASKFP